MAFLPKVAEALLHIPQTSPMGNTSVQLSFSLSSVLRFYSVNILNFSIYTSLNLQSNLILII